MKKYFAALFVISALSFAACKSKDNPTPAIGGKGGNATLNVTPRHHGRQIDTCTIYIKYNSTDAPTNGQYDDSLQCVLVGGIPVASFTNLKKGNYYLYGFGWDPTLTPPQHVKGGYAYSIQTETVQSVDLAISED
ncbi:MAG: hypothetical protein ABI169_09670 [Chitinophagaceae bacterium]